MSYDLGRRHWRYVGIVDGFVLVTHAESRQSRWLDLHRWPPKPLPIRDEWTRAVCAGATLVGWNAQRVYTWSAPEKRRTPIALPKEHGYRAVGMIEGRVVLVPGALEPSPLPRAPTTIVYDNGWRPLAGAGGHAATMAGVVGRFVVWGGRVLRYADGLLPVVAGDLPASDGLDLVPDGDGFITVAGGKLVFVSLDGAQREDRAVGQLALVGVTRYEGALLLRDARKHYLYDREARTHAPLDLGTTADDPATLFAAPAGLIGLTDDGRYLIRYRV